MSFGLEVFAPNGEKLLRVTDPALRIVYRRALSTVDSGSHPLPGYSAANADAYVIAREHGKRAMAAWMSANAVNWGYDSWWPIALVSAGELIVVARK